MKELVVPKRDALKVEGRVRLAIFGPDGELKYDEVAENIITQVGRTYLTKRAAAIATMPNQVVGMKLGTSSTAEAVTGAGAALGGYISGSHRAIDGGYPTEAIQGNGSRVTWQSTWGPGVATNPTINEVVLVNDATLTDANTTAPTTVGRVVVATANKAAGDTAVVTWTWDIGI